jgi:hypothetical protein
MKTNELTVYAIYNVKGYPVPTMIDYMIIRGKLYNEDAEEITKSYRAFWDSHKTFTAEEFWSFLKEQFEKYGCEVIDVHPHYGEIYLYGRVSE